MELHLTEKAKQRLQEIITAKGENLALRVLVRPGGCSGFQYGMALERKPREDDHRIEIDGITVLVDPVSLPYLEGSTIDYIDSLMGAGFTIQNPNAVATCACGYSFRTASAAGAPQSCGVDCAR